MRAWLIISTVLVGCVGASTTPLAPEGPVSEAGLPARNKVASPNEPAPDKANAVEPARSAAPVAALAPSAATESSAATPPPKGLSTTRLLSAGAEPRQELRFVFHRGESLRWRLRSDMTMDMTIDAPGVSTTAAPRTVHQLLPTTECTGTTVTRTVDADGTAHREGWIDGFNLLPTPGVEPSVQSKVEEMLRGVGKIPFQEVIDTRGQISDSKLDLSSIHDPTMLQTMEQMAGSMSGLSAPWPVEAVGVGAKWQVQSNVGKRQQLARTVVVTLISLRGKQVQLEMSTNIVAGPDNAKNGVSVLRTEGGGNAQLDIQLDPFSHQSHSSAHTSTETIANGVRIRMKIDTETEFRALDKAAKSSAG